MAIQRDYIRLIVSTEWTCISVFYQSLLLCSSCSSGPQESGTHRWAACRHLWSVLWLCLCVWLQDPVCLDNGWVRYGSGVCSVESQGCWMCVCVQQRPLMICASLRARLVLLLLLLHIWHFCPCAFEKVEHIIHRQGHTLSSRPPLLHPHNARCHAHSCQLVPVCLPMPITAGQFTFSAHTTVRSSVLDVDTCRQAVFFSLFFWHAGKKIKHYVLTSSISLQLWVYYRLSPQAFCLAPRSPRPLKVTHPTPVSLSSTSLQLKKLSPTHMIWFSACVSHHVPPTWKAWERRDVVW